MKAKEKPEEDREPEVLEKEESLVEDEPRTEKFEGKNRQEEERELEKPKKADEVDMEKTREDSVKAKEKPEEDRERKKLNTEEALEELKEPVSDIESISLLKR